MEESFRERVSKTFGSLSSSSTSQSLSSSLWSLTDEEIEPQLWNREAQHELEAKEKKKNRPNSEFFESFPCGDLDERSVDYGKLLEKDLEDELDGEDGENEDEASGSNDLEENCDEELEIKRSIGLDPTLDNEAEEDEHDKVAVGKEKAGDRLYMKDVKDYETDADYYSPLPSSFRDISRDPRANIIAAKARLKEDAEAARKIETLKVSDKIGPSGNSHLKPILKRKDDHSDSKTQKRVRFDTDCVSYSGEEGGAGEAGKANENLIEKASADEVNKTFDALPMESCSKEEVKENLVVKGCSAEGYKDVRVETSTEGANQPMLETYSSKGVEYIQTGGDGESSIEDHPSEVPAHLRNPSKYTHYTFDPSTDMDEESNRQAFMDFLNLIKKAKATDLQPEDDNFNSSKPVAFIPKRKSSSATAGEGETRDKRTLSGKEIAYQKGSPVGMITMDDICAMEEDEPATNCDRKKSARRSGRQYRTRATVDSEDSQS